MKTNKQREWRRLGKRLLLGGIAFLSGQYIDPSVLGPTDLGLPNNEAICAQAEF